MTWASFFTLFYVVYAVSVVIFLIMDRRSPQSTFAWLLLLLGLPVLGLIIYVMTGRSWRAFSRETEYVRKDIGGELASLLAPVIPPQPATLAAIRALNVPLYTRLVQLGRRNSYAVVTTRNQVELLQDAVEKYPRLYADMEAARETIHLEYFSWASDDAMARFNELLLRKVKEGVKVRLLYDAVGSFKLLHKRDRTLLAAGGVEIVPSSPIFRLHTISYRNHRKIAVIDGRVGYIGGLNMGEEHLKGTGRYTSWRDTHLRLVGEAVRALQAAFVQDWYHATRRPLLDAALFPPLEKPLVERARVAVADAVASGAVDAQLANPTAPAMARPDAAGADGPELRGGPDRDGDAMDSSLTEAVEEMLSEAAAGLPVAPGDEAERRTAALLAGEPSDFSGNASVQLISSGPDSRHEAIRQLYFYMVTSASHHVYIQSPFFILDASLAEALKATAMAGVDVKIMLAPQSVGDNPVPYWAAYTYMLDMMGAGVKIYLYQPGYLHSKTVSVDGLVCSVGSANMDIRSFNIDYEINAIVYDANVAEQLEADFVEDLKDCVLFDPKVYKKLPFRIRFRDAAARLLSPLL
jgi:phosphatidylserine/phosphatidylglycerophosphate/cardiolipin synthase-like enzyme